MNFKHVRTDTGWIFECNTAQLTREISSDPVSCFVNVKVAFRSKSRTTNFTLKWPEIKEERKHKAINPQGN